MDKASFRLSVQRTISRSHTVNQEFSKSSVVSDMRQEGAAQDRDNDASDAVARCPHFVGFTGF